MNLKTKKVGLYLLVWMLIVAPIIFVWHVEIGWIINPDIYFTNGFMDIEPIQVYHIQMYLMFLINSIGVLVLLLNQDKILKDKEDES